MKTYITLIAAILLSFIAHAQEENNDDKLNVSIDWENEVNKNHTYKNTFSQKDESYIKWIYKTSKVVSSKVADQNNSDSYYHDGKGNDPIAFTVEENDIERIETYKNVVRPSNKKFSRFSIDIGKYSIPKIEGKLQKGITTYFSDSSKGYEMGIKMDNDKRKVKIEILDLDKNLIHIIEDQILQEGWNHYKWDITHTKSGKYILKYTVDDKEMSQVIKVEKHKGTLIGRFFDWLF